jgi:hypothetical protein
MHFARVGSVLCFTARSSVFVFIKLYFTSWDYSTFLSPEALTPVNMTNTKSCRLIKIYRSFGRNIYLEYGDKMILLYIVNVLLHYMALTSHDSRLPILQISPFVVIKYVPKIQYWNEKTSCWYHCLFTWRPLARQNLLKTWRNGPITMSL